MSNKIRIKDKNISAYSHLRSHASHSKIVSELLSTVVHLSYLGDGLIDLGVWCSVGVCV